MHLDVKGSCREFGHPQEKVDVSSLQPMGSVLKLLHTATVYLSRGKHSQDFAECTASIWVLDTIIAWLGLNTYVRHWSSWASLYCGYLRGYLHGHCGNWWRIIRHLSTEYFVAFLRVLQYSGFVWFFFKCLLFHSFWRVPVTLLVFKYCSLSVSLCLYVSLSFLKLSGLAASIFTC